MRSKRFNVVRLGMVLTAALALSACRQEVHFTKTPAAVVDDSESTAELTTMFVAVPINLDAVAAQVDQAIPRQLKRIAAWLDDAACFKRKNYIQCEGARADTYFSRDGAIRIVAAGSRLNLEVPFSYVVKARGLGPARRLRETSKGKLVAIAGLEVALGRNLVPTVQLSNRIGWSNDKIKVMNGALDLKKNAGGRIRRLLRDTAQTLEAELLKAPLSQSATRVWKALHNPVKLQSEPDVWLTNSPELIADGGFAMKNGKAFYKFAIGTRMAIVRGSQSPQPQFVKNMPRRGRSFKGQDRSTLRMPVRIEYDAVRTALKQAWPTPIEMPGGIVTKPMRVTVNDAQLFPSKHLVALGLDLDVETPDRAFDLTGMAYLTATPVVDGEAKLLTLRNIKLAQSNAIQGIGAGTGQRLRLTAAPFIAGFNQSVKIDVKTQLQDVFANANAMLNQSIGEGLWLHGRFDAINVGQVRPGREGFTLSADLTGELFISEQSLQARAATAVPSTKTQ